MVKKICSVTLFMVYLFVWFFLFRISKFLNHQDIFNVFSDLLGRWIILFGYAIAILILFSPLVLKILNKKHALLKGFVLTILFCAISVGAWFLTANTYCEFTAEKWEQYPSQRWLMATDLKSHLLGTEVETVEKLLGKPDGISGNGTDFIVYFYQSGTTEEVQVIFINGFVNDIKL